MKNLMCLMCLMCLMFSLMSATQVFGVDDLKCTLKYHDRGNVPLQESQVTNKGNVYSGRMMLDLDGDNGGGIRLVTASATLLKTSIMVKVSLNDHESIVHLPKLSAWQKFKLDLFVAGVTKVELECKSTSIQKSSATYAKPLKCLFLNPLSTSYSEIDNDTAFRFNNGSDVVVLPKIANGQSFKYSNKQFGILVDQANCSR